MTSPGRTEDSPRSAVDHAVTVRSAQIHGMVADAIRHRQALLAFQPVVQASDTTRATFQEALIRVLDDTGRVIPAKSFIHVIRDSDVGLRMDCVALDLALRELAIYPKLRLSVNLCAVSVGYPAWRKLLESRLESDPGLAERLILEIAEASVMRVPDLVQPFIAEMRPYGLTFALDQFGAGDTSFWHLSRMQFDILKIDGRFVRDLDGDTDKQVCIRAMQSMADEFDMFTVAESVETAEASAQLAEIGVNCMQGYLFGAPTVTPFWRKQSDRISA